MKKTIIIMMLLALPLFAVVPSVQLMGLYTDNNGQAITLSTRLTGNDPMTLWFLAGSLAGYTNMSHISVTIWDTNLTVFSQMNSENHATFVYNCEYNDWSLLNGSSSWGLNKFYSSGAWNTNTSTSDQDFRLVFTPGKYAQAEVTAAWAIRVSAFNNGGEVSNTPPALYKLTQVSSVGSNQYGGGVLFASPNPLNLGLGQSIKFLYSKTFGAACKLNLQVFTIYGDLVKTLASEKIFTGEETLGISWDGKNGVGRLVASGIYTAVLTINYDSGHKEKQVFNFAVYK